MMVSRMIEQCVQAKLGLRHLRTICQATFIGPVVSNYMLSQLL